MDLQATAYISTGDISLKRQVQMRPPNAIGESDPCFLPVSADVSGRFWGKWTISISLPEMNLCTSALPTEADIELILS
jgi:hypothetical protein